MSTPLSATRAALLVAIAAAMVFGLSSAATAAEVVNASRVVILSNDISNATTAVQHRAEGASGGSAGPASASGSDDSGSGNGNNGHGNNADGVDSSNPSQGNGGPNAEGADSDPNVDDEAGGSGAAPSNGN